METDPTDEDAEDVKQLPKFTEHPFCIKCAGRSAEAKWMRRARQYVDREWEYDEWHVRTCRRCGYKWHEAIIDPKDHAWKMKSQ